MAQFAPMLRQRPFLSAFKAAASPSPSILSPLLKRTSILPAATRIPTKAIPNRQASTRSKPPQVPEPTSFVPNVETFLTLIGRDLSQHATKIATWEALFTLTSSELAELGVEPPRARRYLLQWRERFRNGKFGAGGDFRYVDDKGVADLRIIEVDGDPAAGDMSTPRRLKYVVNVPRGSGDPALLPADQLSRVRQYKVRGARTVVGPYALPAKGHAGALVKVTKGMWENRRGRKIDGGERRRAEVRRKRLVMERREAAGQSSN